MNLKQIKLFNLPALLTIALMGCVSDSSFNNTSLTDSTTILEEKANIEKNNQNHLNAKSINGVWCITINNNSCQLFTTHTKQGKYYLASAKSCSSPMHDAAVWNVKDHKLNIYNKRNELIVSLENTDNNNFNGTTTEGISIVMSR